ncbi:MAG: hypothetical protein EBU90_04440 [Proteobacteria bacterium]|nr:hypothetical protein [Pseudomonadota bacterium]NBP15084.1 hypothetical protein [bacterium]
MSYSEKICDLLNYMKREAIIGTVVVCGLIGVVNYLVCLLYDDTTTTDNKQTSTDDDDTLVQTTNTEETDDSILRRMANLERSLNDLSEKKTELTRLNEQLLHIRNTLESMKESLKR